jgi:hypothetical protein
VKFKKLYSGIAPFSKKLSSVRWTVHANERNSFQALAGSTLLTRGIENVAKYQYAQNAPAWDTQWNRRAIIN